MPKRIGRPPVDPAVRFDAKVRVETVRVELGPCWLWTGSLLANGYAQFQTGGRGAPHALVHRWNYERLVGPIPEGFQVDHLCKVRHCVNPVHLEAVRPAENNARSDSPSAVNARMILCSRGLHELAGDNLHPTYLRRGQRRCRACQAERQREYRAKRRAEIQGAAA